MITDQPVRIRINGVLVEEIQPSEPRPRYNHWRPLHEYRGCDPDWLAQWVARIPATGCGCAAGYRAIVADYPPDFSSPVAFFAWGVTLHNLVNEKINLQRGENRRIFTVDEALALWRPDAVDAAP
jgi:hypothetical protein